MSTALHYAVHGVVAAGIWRAAQSYDKRARAAWLTLAGVSVIRLHLDHHR